MNFHIAGNVVTDYSTAARGPADALAHEQAERALYSGLLWLSPPLVALGSFRTARRRRLATTNPLENLADLHQRIVAMFHSRQMTTIILRVEGYSEVPNDCPLCSTDEG
jgi:hypothetical protein